jgi:hypothetical protein
LIKSDSLADFEVMEQEANTAVKKNTTAKEHSARPAGLSGPVIYLLD